MFDMDHLAPSFLLAIFLLSPGIVAQPPSQQADLILRHGVVLTVDAADSIAEAIAIRDGQSKHLMPLATYRKRSIVFASGSDFGVTPLATRYGLWASVARQPLKGTFGPQPFGTDEAIDVHTALKSYTIWAARQIFEEKNTGSLEPGKWADFAVWDRNPYTVPTGSLKDMQCLMTFYKGKVVFER